MTIDPTSFTSSAAKITQNGALAFVLKHLPWSGQTHKGNFQMPLTLNMINALETLLVS